VVPSDLRRRAAYCAALLAHYIMCVRAPQRAALRKPVGRKIERQFKPIAGSPTRTGGVHCIMCRSRFERTACGQLLIGVSHYETTAVKLASRLSNKPFVLRVIAIACDIHTKDICLRLAMYNPFGQRFPNAAALQKARHHRASTP